MATTRRFPGLLVSVLVVSALLAPTVATQAAHATPAPVAATTVKATPYLTPIAGSPLSDIVIDSSGTAYISNPALNEIEVLSLSTGILQPPIFVGSQPKGLDFSPDGKTLYVANSGASDLSVVDLTKRQEVGRITIPGNDQPFWVAVAATGRVFVTTSGGHLLEVNPTAGTIVQRLDSVIVAQLTGTTLLRASGDRSHIGGVAAGISSAPVFVYSSASDTFTGLRDLSTFASTLGINGTGSTIVVDSGSFVLDGSLVLTGIIPSGGRGVALNAAGTRAYRVQDSTVDVLDLTRNLVIGSLALPEAVTGPGEVALTADGATLAILTGTGVSVIQVSSATPVGCVPPSPAPPPSVHAVCGAPLADIVMDHSGHAYATNKGRNEVEVMSLATGTFEAAIPVGSQPFGLDLSADEKTLYVADSGSDAVSVVDLTQRRETARINVSATFSNDRPFLIAVANNGTALVTTTSPGSGFGYRMLQINLATGTVALRSDFFAWGATTEATRVEASADRSRIAIVAGDISSGPVFVYTAATDSFTKERDLNSFVDYVAIDATGSKLLVGPGTYQLDGALVLRGTIPGGGYGLAISPSGSTGFRVMDDHVDVLNLTRGLVERSIPLPEGLSGVYGQGTAALSADGTTLAVLTKNGIAMLPTDSLTTAIPYSVWSQPTSVPLDGLGTWVAIAKDATPAPGQRSASELYGQAFDFVNSPAQGTVALISAPSGKYAAVSVPDPDGTPHSAAVPFNWQAGRYYFLFVDELSPGVLGAWVYDFTAATWVPITTLTLPAAWGKLSATSATAAEWLGGPVESCSVIPGADVYFYPPVGYVGTTAAAATLQSSGTQPGDCLATNNIAFGIWAHYQMGAASLGG